MCKKNYDRLCLRSKFFVSRRHGLTAHMCSKQNSENAFMSKVWGYMLNKTLLRHRWDTLSGRNKITLQLILRQLILHVKNSLRNITIQSSCAFTQAKETYLCQNCIKSTKIFILPLWNSQIEPAKEYHGQCIEIAKNMHLHIRTPMDHQLSVT